MKKFLFCLVVILAVGLCGCNSVSGKVKPVTKNISFSARITYFNEVYNCKTTIKADKSVTFEVTEPGELVGLTLFYDDQGVKANYMGLTYTPSSGAMPVSSVCQSIYDAFADTWKIKEVPKKKDENCFLKGKSGKREYKMYLSPGGLPLKLDIPDDSFHVEFDDMTVLPKSE